LTPNQNFGSAAYHNSTDYVMSKDAVLGLVRSTSKQLGVHGIRVNCVSLSIMATPMTCHAFGTDPKQLKEINFLCFSFIKQSVTKVQETRSVRH
jgi:NAD(P)-dependent dehydrogenase (short-subunit alcohol dehydrogenase family)